MALHLGYCRWPRTQDEGSYAIFFWHPVAKNSRFDLRTLHVILQNSFIEDAVAELEEISWAGRLKKALLFFVLNHT
jgi:hypothetical protein